jgi:vancomycin resistance protein YoaR
MSAPSSDRPWRDRLARGGSRLAIVLALVIGVLAIGLGMLRGLYDERVYPQVSVAGMNVGGMDRESALAVLQERASELEQGTITLTYADHTWTPTLKELGVSVNFDATLGAAYDVGREEGAWDRVTSTMGLLRDEHHVPLQMTINEGALDAWFAIVNEDLGIPPHDAYIVVEDGKARVEPEIDGTIVDRAAAEQMIVGAITDLQPLNGDLPVEVKIANVREVDLQTALKTLDTALSDPVQVTFEGTKWELTPAVLGEFIVQSADSNKTGAGAVAVELDVRALAKYLSSTYGEEINREPVDAKVAFDPEKNELIATEASVQGVKIKPSSFAQAVAGSFFGGHDDVEVPVSLIAPQVDSNNLDALGITTKLSVGDSAYYGSDEGRAHNIVVGSSLLNGALIPPHGEYSFNHSIGVITADKGYVESGVIQGDRVGRDIGGGICQVSTTVFRAALLAGLEITEWWPHSYRLSFYELDGWEPGMDASILQPDHDPFSGGDFKFRNPSDSWMLMESYTENERVYVIIYGPDLGYNIDISEPVLSEPIKNDEDDLEVVNPDLPSGTINQYEIDGYNVSFTRTVSDKDGNVIETREFVTYFGSHPNVWQVSPDMAGESPASK